MYILCDRSIGSDGVPKNIKQKCPWMRQTQGDLVMERLEIWKRKILFAIINLEMVGTHPMKLTKDTLVFICQTEIQIWYFFDQFEFHKRQFKMHVPQTRSCLPRIKLWWFSWSNIVFLLRELHLWCADTIIDLDYWD